MNARQLCMKIPKKRNAFDLAKQRVSKMKNFALKTVDALQINDDDCITVGLKEYFRK